jgi:ATP-dependent Clp protease ATP-binding subunit ClpC
VFERFTDQGRRVVVLAQEEARLLNHNYIGTEHLLLGVIHEGHGPAAEALAASEMTLGTVREQVEQMIGRGKRGPSGHIPFTPRSKKVLELSVREAHLCGVKYVSSEHLMLALIQEGEGVAPQALVALGVDLEQLRRRVLELLAGQPAGQREPSAPGGPVITAEGHTLSSAALEGVVNRRSEEILRRLDAMAARLSVIERHLGMDSEPGPSPDAAPGA